MKCLFTGKHLLQSGFFVFAGVPPPKVSAIMNSEYEGKPPYESQEDP